MMEALYPYLTGILGAAGAWSLSYIQERSKSKTLDLEYVRGLIDEQIEDLKAERDRSRQEMIRLRERIAVLEANTKDVARLRRENEELRRVNARLAAEIVEMRSQGRNSQA